MLLLIDWIGKKLIEGCLVKNVKLKDDSLSVIVAQRGIITKWYYCGQATLINQNLISHACLFRSDLVKGCSPKL